MTDGLCIESATKAPRDSPEKGRTHCGACTANRDFVVKMVSLDEEAAPKELYGKSHHSCHKTEGMDKVTTAVMMCFEITSGDMVSRANFNDLCHVLSLVDVCATALSANCLTLATCDEHADTEPGMGVSKAILVYDANDHTSGEKHGSEMTDTPNDDGMTNDKAGTHAGTDCPDACK